MDSGHNYEITLLGCGSSGGVPRVGGDWGACDPSEPKNRRRRCSLLVEYWRGGAHLPLPNERTIVLIDTAPDLREQLIDAGTPHVDALFYTHDHGDQTHGIDDLRALAYNRRAQIPTYMSSATQKDVVPRFRYCFEMPKGRIHPPILSLQDNIEDGDIVSIDGPGGALEIEAFEVGHGNVEALGFRFGGKIAYTPDVQSISDSVLERLSGLDVWILDALRYHEHPTHAHADLTFRWSALTGTRQLVTTNMHYDMDYETFASECPGNQLVGFDGMKIWRHYE